MDKIKALVVDDSAFMRKVISDILNSDPDIEVIGKAKDGEEAVRKVRSLHPDVVTLDIIMPRMDGLTALSKIMSGNPTPVVMVSGMDEREEDFAVCSLECGAIDFISKPPRLTALSERRDELIEKVKVAARVERRHLKTFSSMKIDEKDLDTDDGNDLKVVVIGASTGGYKAICNILSDLPRDIGAALLIVQHMGPGFTSSFAKRLNNMSPWEVVEAQDGDEIKPGKALIAPGDFHMTLERKSINGQSKGIVHLDKERKINSVRPSVDVTMKSAADFYGKAAIGVILTGMGNDGARGMERIKEKGGRTLAQDKSSCVVFGMPKATIKLGCVDEVVPLHAMSKTIEKVLR